MFPFWCDFCIFKQNDETKREFLILGITTYVSITKDQKDVRDPKNIYNTCVGMGNYTNLLVYKDWLAQGLAELK